jgi:hypothetical protein
MEPRVYIFIWMYKMHPGLGLQQLYELSSSSSSSLSDGNDDSEIQHSSFQVRVYVFAALNKNDVLSSKKGEALIVTTGDLLPFFLFPILSSEDKQNMKPGVIIN